MIVFAYLVNVNLCFLIFMFLMQKYDRNKYICNCVVLMLLTFSLTSCYGIKAKYTESIGQVASLTSELCPHKEINGSSSTSSGTTAILPQASVRFWTRILQTERGILSSAVRRPISTPRLSRSHK